MLRAEGGRHEATSSGFGNCLDWVGSFGRREHHPRGTGRQEQEVRRASTAAGREEDERVWLLRRRAGQLLLRAQRQVQLPRRVRAEELRREARKRDAARGRSRDKASGRRRSQTAAAIDRRRTQGAPEGARGGAREREEQGEG